MLQHIMWSMPTEPEDKQGSNNKEATKQNARFSGVREHVENNDIASLMRELDKVDTDTKEAILNKISMSDGKGGRIELDRNQMVPMPANILAEARKQLKKKRHTEQEDDT